MNKHLVTLEFDRILDNLVKYCRNTRSSELAKQLCPQTDIKEVLRLLEHTKEAKILIGERAIEPLGSFPDMRETIAKAQIGAMLNMGELLCVADFLSAARRARASIIGCEGELTNLKAIAAKLYSNKNLEEQIKQAILSEEEMSDSASPELASIRRKIRKANDKIREKLSSYITSSSYAKYLQENVITIRQGRFVVPVKAESRSSIAGLVHDQSASGATVFIEPMPIVELNNELKILNMEQAKEIERILSAFSSRVREVSGDIRECFALCAELDLIFAKARYAIDYYGCLPKVNNKKTIRIIKGRHPLIEPERVVPVDVHIKGRERVLLISGPNTGGKTVLLKTVGLFCAMAAVGMLVPAEDETELHIFKNIYCDIGDAQSIQLSLSTFSSHMSNIRDIANSANENDLVILDELGAGTDPYEGAALAIGILRYLLEVNCTALITTHYKELKEFSLAHSGIVNASMEFNTKTMLPTYRVIMGLAGVSNALNIARHIGIKPKIIDYAYESINEGVGDLEQILASAHKASLEAEYERRQAEQLRKSAEEALRQAEKTREEITRERERISANAKLETKKMVQKAMVEANDIIEQMQANIDEADRTALLHAKQSRSKLGELIAIEQQEEIDYLPLDAPPKVGDEVFIKSINAKAQVVSKEDKKGEIEVAVGIMRAKFKREDLGRVLNTKKPVNKEQVIVTSAPTPPAVKEIKLLGCTVFEAEVMLDSFLENAYDDGLKQVKIIHGLGTGALRKGVHEYLRRSPYIKSYRLGRIGEGDKGVTFAELK